MADLNIGELIDAASHKRTGTAVKIPTSDLTDLALTFPNLAASDFQSWVNEGDAQKAGLSVPDFAAQQAKTWEDGLASWGVGKDRIPALRDKTRCTIYTPGSNSGVPINIVGSLQAPADMNDMEIVNNIVQLVLAWIPVK